MNPPKRVREPTFNVFKTLVNLNEKNRFKHVHITSGSHTSLLPSSRTYGAETPPILAHIDPIPVPTDLTSVG